MSESRPLLPTHVNHSHSHRLSTTKISFPSNSTQGITFGEDETDSQATLTGAGTPGQVAGKYRLKGVSPAGSHHGLRRDGLPKFSRECLWSEIKCYGSYILPVFFIFGVLVIGIALILVGVKRGWFRGND